MDLRLGLCSVWGAGLGFRPPSTPAVPGAQHNLCRIPSCRQRHAALPGCPSNRWQLLTAGQWVMQCCHANTSPQCHRTRHREAHRNQHSPQARAGDANGDRAAQVRKSPVGIQHQSLPGSRWDMAVSTDTRGAQAYTGPATPCCTGRPEVPQRLRPRTGLPGPHLLLVPGAEALLCGAVLVQPVCVHLLAGIRARQQELQDQVTLEATSVEDGGRQAEGGARRAEGR